MTLSVGQTGRMAAHKSVPTLEVLRIVIFNLITYILIGLPLAVFPGLVHGRFGFSALTAGLLISLQYLATLITRAPVGSLSDSRGPKHAVLAGLICGVGSGACILAASTTTSPLTVLLWLALSRLWLGTAESGTGTGCIAWGVGRVGAHGTAKVMSWNGVVSYGGIGIGAPLGVMINHQAGLTGIALTTIGLSLTSALFCLLTPGTAKIGGHRISLLKVFGHVVPFGMVLALGSAGFGTIVAFITLYFASRGWEGAAYALSAFGVSFVAIRILFANLIHRFGGFAVTLVSLLIQFGGLILLWLAQARWQAITGATLTGCGMSLIFPAMGTEVLQNMPAASRGAIVGAFTVFLDVALGATGPAAGLVIDYHGYAAVFLAAAVSVMIGACLALYLFRITYFKPQPSATP